MKASVFRMTVLTAITLFFIMTGCHMQTEPDNDYQVCEFPPLLLGEWYDDPNNVWNFSIRNVPPYRIRTGNIYYWPQSTHFNSNRYRVLALRDGTSEVHTFFFENITATTMDANRTPGNVWEPLGGFTGPH